MEWVCLAFAILCLGYYGLMLAVGMDFSFVWLAAGVALAAGGVWIWFAKRNGLHLPGTVRIAGGVCLAAGIAVFLVLEGWICTGMYEKGKPQLEYVIVLGAQVRGNVPSRALERRIQRAEEYLKENPNTAAVLSGGKGNGETISEAQAMYERLVSAGISKERLLMEERSTSTVENLKFSAELIGKDADVGIISQNFHIYRAVKLAQHQGYRSVCGIAASSEALYQPHFMVRESFAIVKEKLTGNMD